MSRPLAIFAPFVGIPSESFIRRHMQHLFPGGTVVACQTKNVSAAGWDVNCPTLIMDQIPKLGLRRQLAHAVLMKFGCHQEDVVVKSVKRFLQEYQVKVIMGEYLDWSLKWSELAQELGIQFFGHAHGYDISIELRKSKWRAEYLKYNNTGGVITMSQASKQRLVELGLEPSKLHVVNYGVDVPDTPLVREDKATIRCIAVGRMVPKKAPILTLDAFRRAAEQCSMLRLDYVGSGELMSAAQQFICAFGLEERVTLHDVQPNNAVQRLIREADIFIQHSMTDLETGDEEGLPVAILEAMAQGLPVVSTTHAGIPEAVLNGTTGYLVEEGDSKSMADRIIALVCDARLRRQMGEAGWHRAKMQFSWDKECDQLRQILSLQERVTAN